MHDIIGPLVGMDMKGLLAFTRMTGDLVKAMLHCGKPVIAAVDGICVGAGAIIAMACDIRFATPEAKTAFLFTTRRARRLRHGRLRDPSAHHRAGPRRGAALHRPHDVGGGRRALGLFQSPGRAPKYSKRKPSPSRNQLAEGPTFAHGLTKTQLLQEWSMSLDQAIESEAQAQAIAMQTRDFERAYRVGAATARLRNSLPISSVFLRSSISA